MSPEFPGISRVPGISQFTHRYMTLHPEKLCRAAFSGAGTYLFPRLDQPFPDGFDCTTLTSRNYGGDNPPAGYARDLRDRTPAQWARKFAETFRFPRIMFIGTRDTERFTDVPSQGSSRYERAFNYYWETKRAGWRFRMNNPDWPTDANLPLFFVRVDADHGGSRGLAADWLQKFWWNFPMHIPYFHAQYGIGPSPPGDWVGPA